MQTRNLEELTWEEVRDLDRSRTVAILPVGAIEAHGPHLPLGTDVIIAEAMARAGAEQLAVAGRPAVILPALGYTAAPFAEAFPGTLSISATAVTTLVVEIAREVARHGFAALAIANAHLDPTHLGALADATDRIRNHALLPVAFPDLTRKAWAARLTDEFRSGACHAGRFEGSIVLAERKEWVRGPIARKLPANPSSLSDAIRRGDRTFEAAGGSRAYFGAPAEATAEEGRASIEALGAILAEATVAALAAAEGRP